MFMPTKNVYVSEVDLPLFDRAAELAGGMSPAVATGLRLYVAQQEKKRKDTEMQTIELDVDEGSIVTTKRLTGRQVLRSQIKDGLRVQIYRVYLTAKGQYAVYTRDDPNWSALARTGINRQLAELRARQRRMSSDDEGYRELFEQIVGLENRRMQIAQLS